LSFFNELKRRNVFKVVIAYVVMSWLVMQVADVILNNIEAPDWIFHVLLLFLAIGLPFAVFFAWAFELTPEGLKREHEVDRTQSITPHTGKKLNIAIFVVMGLALGYFAFDKFVLSSDRETAAIESALEEASSNTVVGQGASDAGSADPVPSIAVLPFADMSPNKDQDYFSDGLSEELLNLLAKIPELQVAARTSSFSFKDQNLEIPEIAKRLKVAHILEGSVRTAGDQIRITAQLIKAEDGYHMWSETYDRKLENVFAIQDEIAAEVVNQLKVTLLGEVPTVNQTDPQAYALFLRGKQLTRQYTPESIVQANELYEQALAIDPGYAVAWTELARNYINQGGNGLVPLEQALPLARTAVNKALAIDPDLGEPHASMGWLAMSYDNDLATAARHFERAFNLEPTNPDIIRNISWLVHLLGRLDEAILLSEYVTVHDPLNIQGLTQLGGLYQSGGRLDEALESYEIAFSLAPERIGAHYFLGATLLLKGQAEEALAAFSRERDDEYRVKGSALALYTLGRVSEYEAARAELEERWGERWPSDIAEAYAWAGDPDSAFAWLEKELEVTGNLNAVAQDPFLLSLHDDPRWLPLLEKAGMSPEQLDAIEFNVTLPVEVQ
jgi:TolB-like protein/Tfp pilus assembly protein PilF